MTETFNVIGDIRGTTRAAFPEGEYEKLQLNAAGDVLLAQALPNRAELVRLGNTWSMRTAAASAYNYVATLPVTTLAVAMLYNGEPAGGKCYVIDNMWVTTIVSTTALTSISLLAQLVPAATMVAPTHSLTTTIITSCSGKANYGGYAKRAVNVATAFADLWEVVGVGTGAATANIGAGYYADLYGGWIVPPGAGFGMNVMTGTVQNAAGIIGCTWHEVQLALG